MPHSHHSVYEVGKSSNGHIDLERIQELIDDAKRSLNLRNFSGNFKGFYKDETKKGAEECGIWDFYWELSGRKRVTNWVWA